MKTFIKSIYSLRKVDSFKEKENTVFCRCLQKCFFTLLLICFSYGINFSLAAEYTEELDPFLFSFRGVDYLTSPVKISLKGNEVDTSTLIPALERAKQSPYDTFDYIEALSFPTIKEKISSLCKRSNLPDICEEKAVTELRGALDKIYQDLEDQILYPSGYHPINSERVDGFFKKAMDFLDSGCLGNCEDYDLIGAIRYSSPEEYAQLYDKIKMTDEKCQRNILNALAGKLKKEKFPKQCLEEENKNHPVCESMSKDTDIIRGRVLEMTERVYSSDVFKTTEAQAPCLDCAKGTKENDKPLNLFSDIIDDIQEQSQCFDLKPGQEKRVHSGTGGGRSYNLKREADGTYSIPLNLRFSADEDYDGDIPKEEVPAQYMKRVQECISTANEKILGPNGEKLKIVIQDSTQQTNSRCENQSKEIKIGSKEHRSNAGKYEANIDCPTITHEVLHLLGLCDEYKEPGKYDCRIVTTNSIMANQHERWDNVFEKGENNSLLTPGQFNAILYGSCEKKNQIFNQCAQLAYRDANKKSSCMERKQQCETQNTQGLGKEEEMKRVRREIEENERALAIAERLNLEKSVEALNEKLNSLRERWKVVESWP